MFKFFDKTIIFIVLMNLLSACGQADTPMTPLLPTTSIAVLPTTPAIPVLPTNTLQPSPTQTFEGRIVFYSERDGDAEIYLMNPDGSQPQNLTRDRGRDYWPEWNPKE